jgi:5-methylcytosine-specific restriction endonuclease McrA
VKAGNTRDDDDVMGEPDQMPGKIPRARRPVIRSLASLSYDQAEGRREAKRFYASTVWRRLRALFLVDEPLCHDCEQLGRLTPAVEVHHVQARRKRPDLALDPENLMGLCKPHHPARTARGE